MKCKLFLVSNTSQDENKINEWLKTIPGINIIHFNSNLCDSGDVLLTIFYSDRKDKLNNLKDLNT
jgi:hypothetical protein